MRAVTPSELNEFVLALPRLTSIKATVLLQSENAPTITLAVAPHLTSLELRQRRTR